MQKGNGFFFKKKCNLTLKIFAVIMYFTLQHIISIKILTNIYIDLVRTNKTEINKNCIGIKYI